ncbi:MAG: NAD(P)H-dependent oxidoreductase subunit E [Planctomycetota bacterium]
MVRNVPYLEPVETTEPELDEARREVVDRILAKYEDSVEWLVPILQDVSAELNWLSPPVLKRISVARNIPLGHVLRIATFYRSFSLEPRGEHVVNVCMGTACHVKGAPRIVDRLERELGIKVGDTTSDGKFTLETVRCVGCCGLAPVMTVGETFHGNLTPTKAARLVDQLAKQPAGQST